MEINISIEIDGKRYSLEEAKELHRRLEELLEAKTNIVRTDRWFIDPTPCSPIYPYKPYYEPFWSITCSSNTTT